MSSQPKTFLTPEQYLEIERRAELKSEYYHGEVFAMAGASEQHVLIAANISRELGNQLDDKPCRVYVSDLRLRVSPTGLYTYPDIMAVCGKPEFADEQRHTLLNPSLILEVLSKSTRGYDLDQKFKHYRTLPSLSEYVTVDQYEPHVELHTRQPDGSWLLRDFGDLSQSVPLVSIDCVLTLSRIYRKIDW